MDFTELYRHSASLVAFSPGAHFILTAVQDRIIVRKTDTFQITRTWLVDTSPSPPQAALFSSSTSKPKSVHIASTLTDGWITHLGWSHDSEFILAACAKRGVVHLRQLRDENWSGRIDSGAEGDGQYYVCHGHCHLITLARPCQSWMGPRCTYRCLLLRLGCEYLGGVQAAY